MGWLWQLEDAELLSSAYALEEARRNLALGRPPALARLERLTSKLTVITWSRSDANATSRMWGEAGEGAVRHVGAGPGLS